MNSLADTTKPMEDFMFLMSIGGPTGTMVAYTCLNCGAAVMSIVEGVDDARRAHGNYHKGQMPVLEAKPRRT